MKSANKKLTFLLASELVLFFGFFVVAFAGDYTLLAPISGLTSVSTSGGFGDYLSKIYSYSIAIAGVLAVLMLVWGGFKYMTTDSILGKSDGKEIVNNALLGLVLVFASWLILYTINPNLVNWNLNFGISTYKGVVATNGTDASGDIFGALTKQLDNGKQQAADLKTQADNTVSNVYKAYGDYYGGANGTIDLTKPENLAIFQETDPAGYNLMQEDLAAANQTAEILKEQSKMVSETTAALSVIDIKMTAAGSANLSTLNNLKNEADTEANTKITKLNQLAQKYASKPDLNLFYTNQALKVQNELQIADQHFQKKIDALTKNP
jgi:hypothetical protein